MSQAVTLKDKVNTVRNLFTQYQPAIAAALPRHMTAERMGRIAITACTKTPKLLDCTQSSLVGSVLAASQLGLELDDGRGHAWLVPYGTQAQLLIGYRGLMDLATRSGRVLIVLPHVVYERDRFSYTVKDGVDHAPDLEAEDRGKPRFYYAEARLTGGEVIFGEPWSVAKVNAHREKFSRRGGGQGIKMTDEDYGKKTVIRELCKYLPSSPELQRAVVLDEIHEVGGHQPIDADFIVEEELTKEPATPTEGVKLSA